MNLNNLCLGCMRERNTPGQRCPHCGFDLNEYSRMCSARVLKPGTILNGQYLLGKVLGEGGFGITYLAMDLNLKLPVAIKEYFPAELAFRDMTGQTTGRLSLISGNQTIYFEMGMKGFVEEAQNLRKFRRQEGVVQVSSFFYENGTAYMVMEYISGKNLKEYLKELGRPMSERETLDIMMPILKVLVRIHAEGMVHRDISPDNIMLGEDGKVYLIDFGAARISTGEKTKSLTVVLKRGYAPFEQYQSRARLGPWTDIYAVCAVMYRMMSGKVPQESSSRVYSDEMVSLKQLAARGEIPKVSSHISGVIQKGMSVKSQNRYQNAQDLLEELSGRKLPPAVKYGAVVSGVLLFFVVGNLFGGQLRRNFMNWMNRETPSELTPVPEPTITSKPTKTPKPTAASEPTKRPEPTVVPEPTATPTPTEAPEPTAAPEPFFFADPYMDNWKQAYYRFDDDFSLLGMNWSELSIWGMEQYFSGNHIQYSEELIGDPFSAGSAIHSSQYEIYFNQMTNTSLNVLEEFLNICDVGAVSSMAVGSGSVRCGSGFSQVCSELKISAEMLESLRQEDVFFQDESGDWRFSYYENVEGNSTYQCLTMFSEQPYEESKNETIRLQFLDGSLYEISIVRTRNAAGLFDSDGTFPYGETSRMLTFSSYMQYYGWTEPTQGSMCSGITGRGLRLEALRLSLYDADGEPGIYYRVYVQNRGWQDWGVSGEIAGTMHEETGLEAVEIALSDTLVEDYDLLYRVHVANEGWQEWVTNGATCGIPGSGNEIQGIQIRLREKG